jgi:ribA/ribD-fused uncharacterized protein
MKDMGITDLDSLLTAVRRGQRPKYLMFWSHQSKSQGTVGRECLSQWWPAAFMVDGERYGSAEHFMMAEKARVFGDEEMRRRILDARNPGAAKRFGREVRGFQDAVWTDARFPIVVRGNDAKFRQNPALGEFLIATKDRVLVEASPVDRIWGIGLAADAPGADNPEKWRGLNLLGFALMKVRAGLASLR